MIEKARAIGTVLLGIVIVLGVIALPIVFIKGALWASENLFPPLVTLGWLVLALNIFILLPLSLFRSLRGYTGSVIFLSSYVFGLVTWLLGFILTYVLWGLWAVVFGILLFGGGVVPFALLATLFNGSWEPFFALLILVVMTYGARVGGVVIAGSAK